MIKAMLPIFFVALMTFAISIFSTENTSINTNTSTDATHTHKININTANAYELKTQLIGIGEKLAEEIIEHRKKYGHFTSLEDLDKVRYIGQHIIKKNKHIITF